MSDSVEQRMRDDWNARAREDASYYVAFGRRDQDPEEFFATAEEVEGPAVGIAPHAAGREPPGLAGARNRMRARPSHASHEPPLRSNRWRGRFR